MRLGVLDVGSNTIHLQVVDAHLGGPPIPNSSHKSIIKLTEFLDEMGSITYEGIERISEAIQKNMAEAQHLNIDELLAFATCSLGRNCRSLPMGQPSKSGESLIPARNLIFALLHSLIAPRG